MTLLMLSIITVLFFLGVGVRAWRLTQVVPGAGVPGRMEAAANVSAQQALVFDVACVAAASVTLGLISISIPPAPLADVSTSTGAVYTAAARASGGRGIYGYMPVALSATGFLIQNTQGNAAWFRVSRQGTAVNMMTGVTYAMPTMIPVGALIDWVRTTT